MGLVTIAADDVDAAVAELTAEIAKGSPQGLAASKSADDGADLGCIRPPRRGSDQAVRRAFRLRRGPRGNAGLPAEAPPKARATRSPGARRVDERAYNREYVDTSRACDEPQQQCLLDRSEEHRSSASVSSNERRARHGGPLKNFERERSVQPAPERRRAPVSTSAPHAREASTRDWARGAHRCSSPPARRLGIDAGDAAGKARRPQSHVGYTGVHWAQGDLLSGEGIDAALDGIDTVIHCATQGTRGKDVVSADNLIAAARRAKTANIIYVSIVGIDRIPMPYYKAKLRVEEALTASASATRSSGSRSSTT